MEEQFWCLPSWSFKDLERIGVLYYLVVPTKQGTLDAFSFNRVHRDSRFVLTDSPCSPAPLSRGAIKSCEFNMQFAMGVFSYCFLYAGNETHPYRLDLNKFKQYGDFTYGVHGLDVFHELKQLSGIYGVCDRGTVPIVNEIKLCDASISFESVYFNELISYMREADENGDRKSFYTSLLNVSALKWRNRSAFEVAAVICSLVERRGSFRGGKAELRLDTLLKQCPLFAYRYNNAPKSKKNDVLKSVIVKAVEYINSDEIFDRKYKRVDVELPSEINRFKLGYKITLKVGKKNE